ncbi:DUF2244 domain-containing protein [Paracoccus liaowanqingii]|uniref:DUF2244 domain-containing protein n=1 Tax=Paracoccus liaowanqingii TaxID=2560053 RepID=A0A4P7HM91_9RHOB|nr:DUF2244 domain-containing protein [Paracoccus liaowanqingii]QBX35374.1 DUF2244 domain-containing protein [Paracoccus liaowanqingii]TGN55593.1 DUF2244 domain-containing protein [Paracoccus liaowanqingii]
MPYQWTETAPDTSGAFLQTLTLWPHRSLPKRGFVWFIAVTAAFLSLPILAVLGTGVLWGLLPFMVLAVGGVWFAIQHSYRSGQTREELVMDRSRLQIRRNDPGRPERIWQTNSYWVRPVLRKGPVEAYLTLSDGQREIELGAFLTPDERRSLCDELLRRLSHLR